MHSYKTSGIVLKGTNFGEADKILTIFCDNLGKIKVMAKGVRKMRSHLAGSLEPFMLVNLQLHEGKTFYLVTGAAIEKEFADIHIDLNKIAKAFFYGELIDHFLEEKQRSTEIFQLFVRALDETDLGLPGPQIQAFELKIIEASGFKPELYECVSCKEKIIPGQNFWDHQEGGVICSDCHHKFRRGQPITDEVIKLFRFFEKNDASKIAKLKLDFSLEKEADDLLSGYLSSLLERRLESQNFLERVNKK